MFDGFSYREGRLCGEETPLEDIAAQTGTPVYVYSREALHKAWQKPVQAFTGINPLICFAVKANSSRALMALLASWGAGADIVSGGEMQRAIWAGLDPGKIVYSGVGKTGAEIEAALKAGILLFNVESAAELGLVNETAGRLGVRAPVGLRVNPDVDAKTHPKITTGLAANKFGLAADEALAQYKLATRMPHLEVKGISCHIGSQITDTLPFADAAGRLLDLSKRLESLGITLEYLDMGGGLGITYQDEEPPAWREYAAAVAPLLRQSGLKLILEPGRSLVGNAGVLLTRVLFTKQGPRKKFAVVDAAMNDLLRPSMYDAYHRILPLRAPTTAAAETVDVVGPICESGDYLARERELPPLESGDYLAVMSAGAYGFSMSSNYNSRPQPPEVMIKGKEWELIRPRQTVEALCAGERLPGWMKNND
ncbi:MAG: diaminopimelate decarboxylase [Desulfarculales bacterium]|jgi:diaminopimelate decarboxylase|nr:diaminopimelate decarboxylase [Desulfarculales bacterium]